MCGSQIGSVLSLFRIAPPPETDIISTCKSLLLQPPPLCVALN